MKAYFESYFQVQELKTKMQSSGMPWPGDEGEQRWEQAWLAIKKVRMLGCICPFELVLKSINARNLTALDISIRALNYVSNQSFHVYLLSHSQCTLLS